MLQTTQAATCTNGKTQVHGDNEDPRQRWLTQHKEQYLYFYFWEKTRRNKQTTNSTKKKCRCGRKARHERTALDAEHIDQTVLSFQHLAEESSRVQYSREFLLRWKSFSVSNSPDGLFLPGVETSDFLKKDYSAGPRKPRKRGKRGGARQRLRRQSLNRIPLPSMMLINAQSLRGKIDELQAHVRFQHEFRDACLLAITESWLTDGDKDANLAVDDFGEPFRLDRDVDVNSPAEGAKDMERKRARGRVVMVTTTQTRK
ncbi:hypothetical protein WMY93_022646 [Mugilogobius chulae]|uniref:Uncharacterized protein n=1 Tax=Mugilogobius chulae TaxID=88201 RepID=A0AAW0NJV4_9GOBI